MRTPGITGLPDPLAAGLALGGLPGLAGCFVIPLDQFNGADRATVEAGITVFRGLLRCALNDMRGCNDMVWLEAGGLGGVAVVIMAGGLLHS